MGNKGTNRTPTNLSPTVWGFSQDNSGVNDVEKPIVKNIQPAELSFASSAQGALVGGGVPQPPMSAEDFAVMIERGLPVRLQSYKERNLEFFLGIGLSEEAIDGLVEAMVLSESEVMMEMRELQISGGDEHNQNQQQIHDEVKEKHSFIPYFESVLTTEQLQAYFDMEYARAVNGFRQMREMHTRSYEQQMQMVEEMEEQYKRRYAQ